MAPALFDLLEDPLGTYHDYDILSKACQTSAMSPVELSEVMLEYNNEPIGYVSNAKDMQFPIILIPPSVSHTASTRSQNVCSPYGLQASTRCQSA